MKNIKNSLKLIKLKKNIKINKKRKNKLNKKII